MTMNRPLRTRLSALALLLVVAACGGDDPAKMVSSAKDFLAKNDTKAAVIQLKNALQKDPSLGEARFLLGKALLEDGSLAAAEVELRKALDLKYPAEQVVPLLLKSLTMRGEPKKAVEEFGAVKANSPDATAELQTALSIAHGATGNIDASKAALSAALAAKPDYIPALLVSARVKATTDKDVPGALAIVDGILARDANAYEAWKLRGDIMVGERSPDEAVAAYRKAIAQKPRFLSAHVSLINTLLRANRLDDAKAALGELRKIAGGAPQTQFLGAQLAYQSKDFKGARDALQQYHKGIRPTPISLQLSGATEYQLGAYSQAQDDLAKALSGESSLPLARRLLVSTYLRMGQPEKALETLKPVLDKIGDSPSMLALAGEVYVQLKDFKKAEQYLTKATAIDPKDPAKRTRLALMHMAGGKSGEAFDELADISAGDSGTVADLAIVSSHLRRNDIDKALKGVDGLEKKRPDDPAVHNLRGEILGAKKDFDGARKAFEKAIALKPAYFPAAKNLALLDLFAKQPQEARRRFEGVLAADPKNVPAHLAIAELIAGTGGKADEILGWITKAVAANQNDVSARIALVDAHLKAKDVKKALAAAQEANSALPDRPELIDVLGRVQMAAGDFNQAKAAYGKLLSLQPQSPTPYLKLAEVSVATKDDTQAIRELHKALELKADYLDAQRALIYLLVKAGKHREALAAAKNVQKQRPGEPYGYSFEGDVLGSQKAWGDAAKSYRVALEKGRAPELAIKAAASYEQAGNKAEAEKIVATWLKDNPKDVVVRQYLAEVASSRGDWAGAVKNYRAILELSPNSPRILNNLAWALGQMKDPKAIEFAEKAVGLAPNYPALMDTLAVLLLEKGDAARSVELLKKAVDLAPNEPEIRFNLARALAKSGDKAEARKQLETLAKLGDRYPRQAEVAQMIKEL